MEANLDYESINKLPSTSGIYSITNLKTNKLYIGSAVNFIKRLKDHFKLLKSNRHHSKHLQNSFNKYGKECFIVKIENEVNNKLNLVYYEQQYINAYQSYNPKYGYNSRPIANSQLGFKHSDKTKKLISEKLMLKVPGKPVLKYNLEGNFIKEYNSAASAARDTKCEYQDVTLCASGHQKSGKKFMWVYKTNDNFPKLILKYSRKTNLGLKWTKNQKESFSKKKKGIKLSIAHKEALKKASFIKGKFGIKHPRSKKIGQYDLDNNFINMFYGSREAERLTGISNKCISAACKDKKRKISHNFIWKYLEWK